MATDFTYGGKQNLLNGPFKPSRKDMPSDARTRVESYADIANIPNPYVGLKITVKVDETNNNKMTDYIVKSLKANSMGVANSAIDEAVRYVDYLGVSGGDLSNINSAVNLNSEKINELNSQMDTIANKGTTVEVLERVTKEEIERQIADGTMANLTIADGSITSAKLDATMFGASYILSGVEKTWLSYSFIKLSQKYSNCKLKIKFDYTPNNDTFFKILTNKFSSETTSIIRVSANVKTTIDKEIELIGSNTFDIIKLETSSSELKSFDGRYENIAILIDGNNVSYEVLEPSIGTLEKNIETDLSIANKSYVDNKINKIETDMSLKSNMYDLSIPVSINQIDNLKLVFSEDFTENNIDFKYTNCTYGSTDGMTMGADSKIEYKYDVAVDTFRQKFIIQVLDKNSTFGITTSAGAHFMIDCANNKILSTIKESDAVKTTEVDIDFNIEVNKYYILEVVKDGLNHNFTIYDKSTGKRTSFSKVVMFPWGVGVVGFKCDTGRVKVLNYKYFQALFKNPLAIFIGDSITEGISMGTYDISKRWCSLIRDNYFKGNALIFGKGYDTSSGALTRLNNLYRQGYTSKYVFIMIGTNESGSDTALASWKENIVKIYDLIISNNALPIIITPPLSRTNVNYIVQMKDFIQEKGWDTIRMDLALSVNNDGITYDNQYYQDGTHPNVLGGQLMYERALFDLDMIM